MNYPQWICHDCGKARERVIEDEYATWHKPDKRDPTDRCGWCGTNTYRLTNPEAFGWPLWQSGETLHGLPVTVDPLLPENSFMIVEVDGVSS